MILNSFLKSFSLRIKDSKLHVVLNVLQSYFLHIRGLGHIQKTEELEKRKRGLIAEKPDEKKSSYPKPVKTTKPVSNYSRKL